MGRVRLSIIVPCRLARQDRGVGVGSWSIEITLCLKMGSIGTGCPHTHHTDHK